MKITRFLYREEPRYGLIREDHIELIHGEPFDAVEPTGVSVALSKAKLMAPSTPAKIVAVGLNYRDHAKELNMDLPDVPCIFLKPSSSLIATGNEIVYPASSEQVEYEGELAVIIGKKSKDVSRNEALDHVFGFSCANDVTARDLQRMDKQWTRAKSFDTFCPLGPHVETDLDPGDLSLRLILNGEVKQDSRTGQMVFNVGELVEFISEVMTLYPGDVILTGTPFGVGVLNRGDLVEVEVEGIGTLSNRVV